MGPVPFLLDLVDLEGFADFAEILEFSDNNPRIEATFRGRQGNSTFLAKNICRFRNLYLFEFLLSLPAESTIFRIWKVQKDQSNTP